MGLLSENTIVDLILLITTSALFIFIYFSYAYTYWDKRGIAFLTPRFPVGNSPIFLRRTANISLESIAFYEEIRKKTLPFAGVYLLAKPLLVIVDPDYIKDVLSKDFHNFIDRGFYYNEKDDPLSAHLFAVNEKSWKNMRIKLTPTFTSGKMKNMFPMVAECSGYMIDAIEKCASDESDINSKDFLARFTTDVIGACAFGITCNSFKYPDAEFRKMGMRIFRESGYLRQMKFIFITCFPKLALKLGCTIHSKDVSDFFDNLIESTVKFREENNNSRNDFIQLLIDLKNSSKETENPLTIKQLAAQVFLFFVAGFDTSSTAMNFALYELSRHPDIQDKVRNEIEGVLAKHDGNITYESLGEMKYLQQVFDETLRLYPPVPNLTRVCVKEYTLRDTDAVVEVGTPIVIPIIALHRDPEHYPDPDKFDPERFNLENKNSRHPYLHLPFGEGPRNCIGLRFGIMQSKIGLIKILRKFKMSISPKTKMPLVLDRKVFLLKSTETLYLKAEKI